MPIRFDHDADYVLDVGIRNIRLKEVAHAVDEDSAGTGPFERLRQLFGNKTKIKTLLIRMTLYATEPLGECLRIAVLTTGAYFGAPS